jgi:hypothetical protein
MDKEAILKKLRFGFSDENLIVNESDKYLALLKGAAFDIVPKESKIGQYGFVQVFASSQAEMDMLIKSVVKAGMYDCLFWVCYPKSNGNQNDDLTRETVWPVSSLIC